jgi:hypothetical protein
MKALIFAIFMAAITTGLYSQEFNPPDIYALEASRDFAVYEQDVIKCVDWLMNTPLEDQGNKRLDANIFLLEWLKGNSVVKIKPNKDIVTFMNSSPNLVLIFMGGWAKYCLETRDFNNKAAGNLAGIESVIEYYTRNRKSLPKDKKIEKFIKMKENGNLEIFISRQIPEPELNVVTDSSPQYQGQ